MVQYTQIRDDLIDILRYLSDDKYQRELWLERTRNYVVEEDFFHSIDEISHFIFDDMQLDCRAHDAIGTILENAQEAEAVRVVADSLNKCIDALGNASDKEYIEYGGWTDVVSSAAMAYRIITDRPVVGPERPNDL